MRKLGEFSFLLLLSIVTTTLLHALPKNIIFILSDDHRYDYMGSHNDEALALLAWGKG